MDSGLYEVISPVTIRREPRIVEYIDPKTKKLVTNADGSLAIGTQRAVYGITTDEHNAIWGRISMADASGVSQWICLKNVNREFAKQIPAPIPEYDFMERIAKLEEWARTKGYTG